VIEKENRILPSFEENLSGRLRAILEQKNIKIDTAVDTGKYNTSVFDKIILATGRTPNSQGLNLEKAGVICDEKGWIKTDSFMRTNVKNIYACGDITAKKLLAYIAEYQARLCIDNILGKKQKEDYSVLPECVFCLPQIAKVGIGENEAKEKNLKHKIIRSNFLKFSSAHVYDDKQGFIQLIVDQKDIIIGAAIISNFAAELINLLALMIRQKVTLSSFKHCHFIHPTLSEMIPLLLKDIC
jgi:dihydrolipoamide dehydrogenase